MQVLIITTVTILQVMQGSMVDVMGIIAVSSALVAHEDSLSCQ